MTTTLRSARPEDEPAVLALLTAAHLPTDEVHEWLDHYTVAEENGEIVGVAGLEVHGQDGLLRSVAVEASRRGGGLGGRLAATVIATARQAGLRRLYLLTTTAEGFFPPYGFRSIDRADASPEVQESVEFREACPDSAVAMVLDLG